MKYDFDTVCDRRNTDCAKWGAIKAIFGREDVIPMWVADMDFPTAKPITEALERRAAHPFYGYAMPGLSLTEAVVDRMKRKFDWEIAPEWVVFTPGIIPALNVAVRALSRPGDDIIFFTAHAQNDNRRGVLDTDLTAHAEPIHFWQIQIQDNQVR